MLVTDDGSQLFRETMTVIASEVEKGIAVFNPALHTCLLTDWSKSGLDWDTSCSKSTTPVLTPT